MDTLVFLGTGDAMGFLGYIAAVRPVQRQGNRGKIFACALLYL